MTSDEEKNVEIIFSSNMKPNEIRKNIAMHQI